MVKVKYILRIFFFDNSSPRMNSLPTMTSSHRGEMKSEYESTPFVTGSNYRTEILQGPDSSLHLEEIHDVSGPPVFDGLPYDAELSSSERRGDLPDYESSQTLHSGPSVMSVSDDSDLKTLPRKGTPFSRDRYRPLWSYIRRDKELPEGRELFFETYGLVVPGCCYEFN